MKTKKEIEDDIPRPPQAIAKPPTPPKEKSKTKSHDSSMSVDSNISMSDYELSEEDIDDFPEEESKKSSRVFNRLNRKGKKTPYYEYRDTAKSNL